MKVEIRYYQKTASAIDPELKELRVEDYTKDRTDVIEMAKKIELPPAADYAHIFINGIEDASIAVLNNGGVMDVENEEWIVDEPECDTEG